MFTQNETFAYEKGYRVDENGNCFNIKNSNKFLKGYIKNNGYIYISIRNYENKICKISIHRLQAYQKFGNKIYEEKIVIRHLDGNKLNNSFNNIEIGTQSENALDQSKEIRINKSSNANKKYSNELVLEIKEYYKSGHTYKETMEKFNISSKGTLSYIINNR